MGRAIMRVFGKGWKIALTILLLGGCVTLFEQSKPFSTLFSEIVPSVTQTVSAVDTSLTAVESATVTKVIDGDTFVADVSGTEYKVRLIGVDTPESVSSDTSKNCEEGQIASEHTKSILPVGSVVYMTKDVSDTDKYGRLLRYVWYSDPSTTNGDIDTMLNAQLVRDGYAQAKQYPPDVMYAGLFAQYGQEAIAQGLGVTSKWAV